MDVEFSLKDLLIVSELGLFTLAYAGRWLIMRIAGINECFL